MRFAREIGADVCAEGIESIADLVALADLDVAIGQGYIVGRPAEQFTHPQVVAVKALRDATAAAQRFGASETSGRRSSPTGIWSSPPSASAP